MSLWPWLDSLVKVAIEQVSGVDHTLRVRSRSGDHVAENQRRLDGGDRSGVDGNESVAGCAVRDDRVSNRRSSVGRIDQHIAAPGSYPDKGVVSRGGSVGLAKQRGWV